MNGKHSHQKINVNKIISKDDNKSNKIIAFNEDQIKKLKNWNLRDLTKNFTEQNLKERIYPKKINTNCPLFAKNNFILSNQVIEKCNKIYHYMIYQVPCILEGDPGTSKSFSAEMMAKYRQWEINEEEKAGEILNSN